MKTQRRFSQRHVKDTAKEIYVQRMTEDEYIVTLHVDAANTADFASALHDIEVYSVGAERVNYHQLTTALIAHSRNDAVKLYNAFLKLNYKYVKEQKKSEQA